MASSSRRWKASGISCLDVAVVGGGPAGLSAALMLGRCRRAVRVFDDGHYRNDAVSASHGFFTRDGAAPEALRRLGREQLEKYGVEVRAAGLGLNDGSEVEARKLRLATGLRDELPQVDGLEALYGTSVFHCPFCDGYEHADQPTAVLGSDAHAVEHSLGLRDELPQVDGLEALYGTSVFHCPFCDGYEHADQPTAVLGSDAHAVKHALGLLTWTDDVVLLTNGPALKKSDLARLSSAAIGVITTPLQRLEPRGHRLARVRFQDGTALSRRVLFFASSPRQRAPFAAQLGLALTAHGTLEVDAHQRTTVPGCSAAGDTTPDAQSLIVAAAEGTRAAVCINHELQREGLRLRRSTGFPS